MRLEQLTLYDLKNLAKILRMEHGLLTNHKMYNLCKYDLTCVLRNSGLVDETFSKLGLKVFTLTPDEHGECVEFEYYPVRPFKKLRIKKPGTKGWGIEPEPAEFKIKHGTFVVSFG